MQAAGDSAGGGEGGQPVDEANDADDADEAARHAAHDDARTRLAGAFRRLGHALMAHDVDLGEVDEMVAWLDGRAAELEASPPRSKYEGNPRRLNHYSAILNGTIHEVVPDGEPLDLFVNSPASGPWNPMGVGMEVRRDGDGVVARVRCGSAHEGPPERVHGGVLAMLLDEVMGSALTVNNELAFTARLEADYRAAAPLGEELELRARVVERDGRKIRVEAEIRHGDEVAVVGRGLFISMLEARRAEFTERFGSPDSLGA